MYRACKSRFNYSSIVTRGKSLKLQHLLTSVDEALHYCNVHVYEETSAVNWHAIFAAYVYQKNVLFYVLSNHLHEVLSGFIDEMTSPLGRIVFVDLLEGRWRDFQLEGKECLFFSGMLIGLRAELVSHLY